MDGKFGLRLSRKEAVTYATEDTIVAMQTALNITGDATHAGAQEQRDSMKSTGDGNQSDTSSDGDAIPLARFRKSNPRTQGTAKAAGGPEGEKTLRRQKKGNKPYTSSDRDDVPLAKRWMSQTQKEASAKDAGGPEQEETVMDQEKEAGTGNNSDSSTDGDQVPLAHRRQPPRTMVTSEFVAVKCIPPQQGIGQLPFKIGKVLGRNKSTSDIRINFKPVQGQVGCHDSIRITEYEPTFSSPSADGFGTGTHHMPTALELSTIVWKARDYSVDPSSRSEAYGTSIQCAGIITTWDGLQSTNRVGPTRKRVKYGRGAEAITPSDGETLCMSTCTELATFCTELLTERCT